MLTSEILNNITAAEGTEALSRSELQGLTEEQLQLLDYDEASQMSMVRTALATKYRLVMQNAEQAATRRRVLMARMNRAKDVNGPLIVQTIKLRTRIASLLGFATWADYRTKLRMVQNSQNATNFLLDEDDLITDRFGREQTALTALKLVLLPGVARHGATCVILAPIWGL